MNPIALKRMPWKLAVCKLAGEALPDWASGSAFVSYTKTADEISLVCEEGCVPEGITAEMGWDSLRVEGVLDFSLVGIIARITAVLAAEQISVFVISTHDTDYLLVKQANTVRALKALEADGYVLLPA